MSAIKIQRRTVLENIYGESKNIVPNIQAAFIEIKTG